MKRGSGYITDRTCPTNIAHGIVWDMANGYFCSHSEHNFPDIVQSFWSDDEFIKIKEETSGPQKIALKGAGNENSKKAIPTQQSPAKRRQARKDPQSTPNRARLVKQPKT